MFFGFWRDNVFFMFWGENTFFESWREIHIFDFGGKTRFKMLSGKHFLTRFSSFGEITCCLGFGWKTRYRVLLEKHNFWISVENIFFGFQRKNAFSNFSEKIRCKAR